jgi:hypothetical protein
MLVYSRTQQYRHASAIKAGQILLQQIAAEQGFDVVLTEENARAMVGETRLHDFG